MSGGGDEPDAPQPPPAVAPPPAAAASGPRNAAEDRSRRSAARIAVIAFGVLALATVGAFFVAQRLKNSPTVIIGFTPSPLFSPNGDGRRDVEPIVFFLKEDDTVTVEVVNDQGDVVRTLLSDRFMRRYHRPPKIDWNGREDNGRRAPDGTYRIRIALRDRGRTITVPRAFVLDTVAPHPRVLRIGPGQPIGPQILPRPDGRPAVAYLRVSGRRSVLLYRTAAARASTPKLVLRQRLPRGVRQWKWDGKLAGKPAAAGTYLLVVEAQDRAGNLGSSVPLDRRGRPLATYGEPYPGRGGITVRYLAVAPPPTPVTAGKKATFGVDTRRHAYAWSLRRVGRQAARRGTSSSGLLRPTTPAGDAGLHLLQVTGDHATATSPLAVQSTGAHRVLVVLPVLTWQGRNPIDDDGDGRPNTLTTGLPVRLARVYAGDGLPADFAGQAAPLLAALDRAGRVYDLTTDVALDAGVGPSLKGHTGVLIPGEARWLPGNAARRLKAFVRAGGRVTSFGIDGLRRFATVTPAGVAEKPTQPTATDLFGATPVAIVARPVTLTGTTDTIGLFAGTDGQFGPFTGVQRFDPPTNAAAVAAVAVDGAGSPVVLATHVGRGVALRVPIPGFAARLATDPELSQLLRNTWILLSH